LALATVSPAQIASELRRLYPGVLARTLSLTRNVPDAEDAVQEAIARALASWPESGFPDSSEAWLVTVAGNCHRDRLRRASREARDEHALSRLYEMSPWDWAVVADPDVAPGWKDELLGLLFGCCHPALEPGESAAIALATVIGLSTAEIAAAFLVAPRSMEQRLARARARLREQGDFQPPRGQDAAGRLKPVLRTLHLLFNEGYWSTDDEALIRGDLCRLALGLARSLREACPGEPEVTGLLALFLLHEARRPARIDADGAPVPLPEQDRTRWDLTLVGEGTAELERALAVGRPGPFQTEAAISAVHCRARAAAETDWREIAALYALLEGMRPTAAVRVNRAFAVSRVDGPAAGLALLDGDSAAWAATYPYAHLVRGVLLAELGRRPEAIAELVIARDAARNAGEAAAIARRIEALR
jgi:RNA polymerase sigma-70 factor (ECF subfamily)